MRLDSKVSLEQVANEVYWSLKPIPPPLKFEVDERVGTSAIDLYHGKVSVAPAHLASNYIREFVAHELKHASFDGLPYTLLNAKRHEAIVMRELKLSARMAERILNLVYDIVIDCKLSGQGFNIKGFQEYVVSMSPVSNPLDQWGRLNGLYRTLVKANVPGMDPPAQVVKEVKSLVKCNTPWKEDLAIARIASYFAVASEGEAPPNLGCGAVSFGVPEEMVSDVLMMGIEASLSETALRDFVGRDFNVDDTLAEVARRKIWENILAFKDLIGFGGNMPFDVAWTRRAKPYSVKLDPLSVSSHPDDPRKWKERYRRRVSEVEAPGGSGGFSEVIAILDRSDSTSMTVGGKQVISYEKDVVAGLAAFCLRRRLRLTVIPFSDDYAVISGDPVRVVKESLRIKPNGSTEIWKPSRELKNKRNSLVAIVTDGEIDPSDMESYRSAVKRNRIIAVVVNADAKKAEAVSCAGIKVYIVNPTEASNVVIREFTSAINAVSPF